jgi:hypothetical protein
MRFPAIISALIATCGLFPAFAQDDEKLRGNVSESSTKRLPRPILETGKIVPVPDGSRHVPVFIDTAAFDFNAHRKQIEAGTTIGVVPGWIQAEPAFDPQQVTAEMDKFFAPAVALFAKTHPMLVAHPHAAINPSLPDGFNVFVRIGLCGVWDSNGDGQARWRVLASELYSRTPIAWAWRNWQKQVSEIVQRYGPELQVEPGVSSLHLEVLPDGTVSAVKPYEGGERPFTSVMASIKANQNLHTVISNIGRLPPFPVGSQAKECHILVFVSNN